MSSQDIEFPSLGVPPCRVRMYARMSDKIQSACTKILRPHSIGDVPEFKEIREGTSSINVRVEFNPREPVSLRVYSRDRLFCEACQVPNDPMACEHMIWLLEKVARFQFQETYPASELPVTLAVSEDAKKALWEEQKLRLEETYATLKSNRSAFVAHLYRQLELQRVFVTLNPHPIDGDRATAQIWGALGYFLVQLPLKEPIPRDDFLRMHFDKIRRFLKHSIDSGAVNGLVQDLVRLDIQISRNLTRAMRERYLTRDVINDSAEIFVQVLVILNNETHGAAFWAECTEDSPKFFLKTMDYIQSGQTLQRETLEKLRHGLGKTLLTWGHFLPSSHSSLFQGFLSTA